jgi:hypothetical protein
MSALVDVVHHVSALDDENSIFQHRRRLPVLFYPTTNIISSGSSGFVFTGNTVIPTTTAIPPLGSTCYEQR